MKTILIALLLALAVALPLPAAINAVDPVPAATLLLPYFEVDLADPNGTHTSFNVVNVDGNARLAHVTLWTDRGVPTYAFDLGLDAYGMAEVDLRQLFVLGVLPQTESAITGCAATLPPPRLDATVIEALQQAHTGEASALLGGNCGGAAHGDGSARGYITIDVTGACTTTFPTDATYFNSIALLDNVLWGDYAISQRSLGTMHADALVSIEADELAAETDGASDYTFYGHRVAASGADHRENLPGEWWARFVARGAQSTEAIIWRDPGAAASFPCGAPPAGLGAIAIIPFDDQEQPDIVGTPSKVPLATQRVDVISAFDIAYEAGFVFYDLRTNDPEFGAQRQAFVSHVHRSASSSGQMAGWSARGQHDLSNNLSFPPCSDGVDNDGDGLIDGDDPGCGGSQGFTEDPECGDGIDNDNDGLIDFPDDPKCYSAGDPHEWFTTACNDGIDNNGDGLIDFPNDPGCWGPTDPHEGFNYCSDGVDNDGDGLIDHPDDPGCSSPFDSNETEVCENGLDDDGDGLVDDEDPGCSSSSGFTENPQCNNQVDDDGDGAVDLADGGCESASDNVESNPCSDGIDNDGDGDIDFPDDAGCRDADWPSEFSACSDEVDNDGDTLVDAADPGCEATWSPSESPICNNMIDDDGDGFVDMADPSCSSPFDTTEWGGCSDGVDNDGDGLTDFPLETGCSSGSDDDERADCNDGVDNDGDGFIDAADDGCASPTDLNEFASSIQRGCSDGIDNDGDGLVDYPNDPGCLSVYDHVEVDQ